MSGVHQAEDRESSDHFFVLRDALSVLKLAQNIRPPPTAIICALRDHLYKQLAQHLNQFPNDVFEHRATRSLAATLSCLWLKENQPGEEAVPPFVLVTDAKLMCPSLEDFKDVDGFDRNWNNLNAAASSFAVKENTSVVDHSFLTSILTVSPRTESTGDVDHSYAQHDTLASLGFQRYHPTCREGEVRGPSFSCPESPLCDQDPRSENVIDDVIRDHMRKDVLESARDEEDTLDSSHYLPAMRSKQSPPRKLLPVTDMDLGQYASFKSEGGPTLHLESLTQQLRASVDRINHSFQSANLMYKLAANEHAAAVVEYEGLNDSVGVLDFESCFTDISNNSDVDVWAARELLEIHVRAREE